MTEPETTRTGRGGPACSWPTGGARSANQISPCSGRLLGEGIGERRLDLFRFAEVIGKGLGLVPLEPGPPLQIADVTQVALVAGHRFLQ